MRLKIAPILVDNILKLSHAFLEARRRRITTATLNSVSQASYGDNRFLQGLIDGKFSITARKYDEMIDWFDDNWPAKTPMPRLVDPRHGPRRAKLAPTPKRKANGKTTARKKVRKS